MRGRPDCVSGYNRQQAPLCGRAALKEFKQIIRLSLMTDEHTHNHLVAC